MITFNQLRCNGTVNPPCVDDVPVLSWSYHAGFQRDVVQKTATVTLWEQDGPVVFSRKCRTAHMQYVCSDRLKPLTDYQWTVAVRLSNGEEITSPVQHFSTGLLGKPMAFYGARWIAGSKKYEDCALSFRREFCLEKPLVRANAYLFSSAWQKVCVNGIPQREDCWLLPANSSYKDRCLYEKYDITAALKSGQNGLEVLTGGGYNSRYSCFGWHLDCGKALIGFLELKYGDGTVEYIPTDDQWVLYSTQIPYCNIYNGEHFNAALEPVLLEQARIRRSPVPKTRFRSNEMPPVKVCRTVAPVSCRKQGRAYLYDMGENFAGVAKITLSAPRGTKITLQFSEMIYADGTQRLTTNRDIAARDVYICSGQGVETFTPAFTYHGYRYVTVSGIGPGVKILELVGLALSADVDNKSQFHCSDAVVNTIHHNARRGLRSNLMSIPTDCPSRGERTPCAMDSLCTEVANFWNFDVQSYYRKWLGDIAQGADTADDHGNPDWDGDKILLAHRLLKYCGDREIVKKYYADAKACLEMFQRNSPDGLWHEGFGDWCHLNENTWESFHGSVTVVNTCLYYLSCCQMVRMARLLKKDGDAARFAALADQVQKAFLDNLLHPDGTVNEGCQTEQVMALYTGILPEARREQVLEKLAEKLAAEPMDLGIFGMMAIAQVLPELGKSDLLLQLLHNPQYPGYLHQIANGATSLWEVWSFDGPMASHNHAMFAGIEDSFYSGFAGISPLEDGFARFRVKPAVPEAFSFVQCRVDTVSGLIGLSYQKHAAGLELSLDVPVNTQAQVQLPVPAGDWVLYDGELVVKEGVSGQDKTLCLDLGSGKYRLRLVRADLIAPNTVEAQWI